MFGVKIIDCSFGFFILCCVKKLSQEEKRVCMQLKKQRLLTKEAVFSIILMLSRFIESNRTPKNYLLLPCLVKYYSANKI